MACKMITKCFQQGLTQFTTKTTRRCLTTNVKIHPVCNYQRKLGIINNKRYHSNDESQDKTKEEAQTIVSKLVTHSENNGTKKKENGRFKFETASQFIKTLFEANQNWGDSIEFVNNIDNVLETQTPSCTVLSCCDSRVPLSASFALFFFLNFLFFFVCLFSAVKHIGIL